MDERTLAAIKWMIAGTCVLGLIVLLILRALTWWWVPVLLTGLIATAAFQIFENRARRHRSG